MPLPNVSPPTQATGSPEEKRRWAIEQAIKLHASNGVSTDTLIVEAEKLLGYVTKEYAKRKTDDVIGEHST